jgi:DNA replication protein DnaC
MTAQLTTRLRHLRLSGMVEALPARVAQAEAAPLPHLEFLELLVEDELARRADRLFARRLKQAGLVTVKTLADFDWTFNPKIPKPKLVELASARFLEHHGGVLLIGPPGVGKAHMATAIAVGAIRAGRRALVRSTFDLAADFAQAEATGARRDFVQQLTRVDLLVLEDFGMKKLGRARRRISWRSSCAGMKPVRRSSRRTDRRKTGVSSSATCPPRPRSSIASSRTPPSCR